MRPTVAATLSLMSLMSLMLLAAAPAVAQEAAVAAQTAALPGSLVQETVANPYGMAALWAGGDAVARGTLLILLVMSMGSWYVLITKLFEQTILAIEARQAERSFWNASSIRAGAGALGRRSAFRRLVEEGLRAAEQRDGALFGQIDRQSWITLSLQRGVDEVSNRMQRNLPFLATVGSTAPFIGLFGTVWGIYHALTAIGIAGQASIDKVAGPVGEALIMTALGLAVAVPAVLGYNWLIRRNKVTLDRVRAFSANYHALLQGGAAAERRA